MEHVLHYLGDSLVRTGAFAPVNPSPRSKARGNVEGLDRGSIMCGIMGMVLNRRERTDEELENLRERFSTLLVATQVRGKDAAGAFVVNESSIRYHRAPGAASTLVKSPLWWGLMDTISEETTAVVGHTRFATTGCPTCNDNNHPIAIGSLIGVHNGVLYNDDEIRDRYPYEQEVDSAAIFALLNGESKGDLLTADMIADTLPGINGNLAIAVADNRKPNKLFIARDGTRPLFLAPDPDDGIMWIASTSAILQAGLRTRRLSTVSLPSNSIATLTSTFDFTGNKPAVDIIKW